MKSLEDEIANERRRIQDEIARHETTLEALRADLEAFDRVQVRLQFRGTPPERTDAIGTFARAFVAQRKGELTKKALEIVLGSNVPVSARAVREALLVGGFKPGGKNFDVSVVKTLKRLSEQEAIAETRAPNGRVLYKRNDP